MRTVQDVVLSYLGQQPQHVSRRSEGGKECLDDEEGDEEEVHVANAELPTSHLWEEAKEI